MQNENRLLSPIALLFVVAAHALLYWLLTSIKPPELPPEPPGLSFVDLGEIGGGGIVAAAWMFVFVKIAPFFMFG